MPGHIRCAIIGKGTNVARALKLEYRGIHDCRKIGIELGLKWQKIKGEL